MRPLLIVAFLFSLLPLLPSPKERVEIRVRHYPDGALMERAETVTERGKKPVYHGRFQAFSPGGKVIAEGDYLHGLREGPWRYWSETGALQGEGDYRAGRCEFTQYFPDGSIQLRGPMTGALRTGVWTEWYPSGRLRMRGGMVVDAMHGAWEFWTDEDLPRATRAVYDHGKRLP
jgi:uncharacterized protein